MNDQTKKEAAVAVIRDILLSTFKADAAEMFIRWLEHPDAVLLLFPHSLRVSEWCASCDAHLDETHKWHCVVARSWGLIFPERIAELFARDWEDAIYEERQRTALRENDGIPLGTKTFTAPGITINREYFNAQQNGGVNWSFNTDRLDRLAARMERTESVVSGRAAAVRGITIINLDELSLAMASTPSVLCQCGHTLREHMVIRSTEHHTPLPNHIGLTSSTVLRSTERVECGHLDRRCPCTSVRIEAPNE